MSLAFSSSNILAVSLVVVVVIVVVKMLVVVTEPVCDDLSVAVKYDSPDSDYIITMTAEDSYGTCAPFDVFDLRKALLGSGQMWRSTCKKPVAHSLKIEPNIECRGDDWTVQFVTFRLKGAKKVELFVDGDRVFFVSKLYFHCYPYNEVQVNSAKGKPNHGRNAKS